MKCDQETIDPIDVSMFQYRLLNVVLDREIQNAEVRYGPLLSDEVNNDFENFDPTDSNYHNKPQYYRDLISSKNGNHSTPMWNQFVPSHVENMKYLVSKIKIADESQTTAEMDKATNPKLNNQVSKSVETTDINPSPLSSSTILFGDKTENPVLNSNPIENFQMEDIQLVYDWQDDIRDFELQWGIADLLL